MPSLRKFLTVHPLFSFFFMAYAFSWITLIPYILSVWGILPRGKFFELFFVLNPFTGPSLAAYIMLRLTEEPGAWQRLRARIRQVGLGFVWYAFILLGIPALLLLDIFLLPGGTRGYLGMDPLFFVRYPILFVAIFFGGGPLGEEIGWRGYALPRLQARYGALGASLILGVLWTFWHLPHYLTPAQRGGPGIGLSVIFPNLPIFFVMVMALSIIFTWVANHTGGSLFASILLHGSFNSFSAVAALFPAPAISSSDLAFMIGPAALAIVLLILTRGRLGYPMRASSARMGAWQKESAPPAGKGSLPL